MAHLNCEYVVSEQKANLLATIETCISPTDMMHIDDIIKSR